MDIKNFKCPLINAAGLGLLGLGMTIGFELKSSSLKEVDGLVEKLTSNCYVSEEEKGFRGYTTRLDGGAHGEVSKMENMAYELNGDGSIKRLITPIYGNFDYNGNFNSDLGTFTKRPLPKKGSYELFPSMCNSYILNNS